jgi:hypothetical protein
MALKKSSKLNPNGRPKGAVNKTTSEIRTLFQQLVSANIERLQEDLEAMEPEKRVSYIIKLSEFIIPKLQSYSIETQLELEYKQLEVLLSKATPEAIEAISSKILILKTQSNED